MPRPLVLIVDDPPNARLYVRTILEGLGALCLEASEGFEALALADVGIHLVVTNIDLPGMDGLSLFNHIAEGALGRPPPLVVFCSEDIDTAGIRNQPQIALSAGALLKPFRPDHLTALVSPLLDRIRERP